MLMLKLGEDVTGYLSIQQTVRFGPVTNLKTAKAVLRAYNFSLSRVPQSQFRTNPVRLL